MRVFEEYLAGDRELQAPGLWVYILEGVGAKPPICFQIYVVFRNEQYTIAILLHCDSVNPFNEHQPNYKKFDF